MVGPGYGSPLPPLDGGGTTEGSKAAHDAAAGVSGCAQPLPHAEAIQASFGRHDISGIRTQTGGAAGEAAEAMGATAFATGDAVGFAGPASLHTAAHEAAHVVQQRGGVQLKNGIGQTGDTYEQHADRVADRVVRGESAETLLDEVAGDHQETAGAAMAAPAVQASPDPAVYDHAGKLRQLAEAAGKTGQARSGETRSPVIGDVSSDVDTQSVGETFARSLGDDELEQTIEYLIQRRDDCFSKRRPGATRFRACFGISWSASCATISPRAGTTLSMTSLAPRSPERTPAGGPS